MDLKLMTAIPSAHSPEQMPAVNVSCKWQICCNFKTSSCCNFSLGSSFSFIFSEDCAYGLVRLRHRSHLVSVRRRWCSGLKCRLWSPQTRPEMSRGLLQNIQSYVVTQSWTVVTGLAAFCPILHHPPLQLCISKSSHRHVTWLWYDTCRNVQILFSLWHNSIYICIYAYIERARERDRQREREMVTTMLHLQAIFNFSEIELFYFHMLRGAVEGGIIALNTLKHAKNVPLATYCYIVVCYIVLMNILTLITLIIVINVKSCQK